MRRRRNEEQKKKEEKMLTGPSQQKKKRAWAQKRKEKKKKKEEKKRNWAWAQLIFSPKAQYCNCYSHPAGPSPLEAHLIFATQVKAQSDLGPRRIQSPTEMGTRHIQITDNS
jgi:hypothetical protein